MVVAAKSSSANPNRLVVREKGLKFPVKQVTVGSTNKSHKPKNRLAIIFVLEQKDSKNFWVCDVSSVLLSKQFCVVVDESATDITDDCQTHYHALVSRLRRNSSSYLFSL